MSFRRSRSHIRKGSIPDDAKRVKKLEREVAKLRAEIVPLKAKIQDKDRKIETLEEYRYKHDQKVGLDFERLAEQEKGLKQDWEELSRQKAKLESDQNKMRSEEKQFDASRNAYHDNAHDTDKKQQWLEVEEERLRKLEARLKLQEQQLDHGKMQVEQQKLALEHNAELKATSQKTILILTQKLNEAKERLEQYEGKSDASYNQMIDKIRDYPEWVTKQGWDYQRGRKQMDNILLELEQWKKIDQEKESLMDQEAPRERSTKEIESGSLEYVDLTLKYQEQLNMNSLLHEELERVHADYQQLQKGLAANMAGLGKNEDLLVHHVHEILNNYEESSVPHLSEKNPNVRTEYLVNASNNKIRALMPTVNEMVWKGYSEAKLEGSDGSLLNQVHMNGEMRLLLEELLLKIGRLLIGMNHQISHNLQNPGGGEKKIVALSKGSDTEMKLVALRKKHEELQQHCSLQEDAMMLLKQQCHEQSMRHAQIHGELETVLKFFLRARGQNISRSGEAKSGLTVEKLYTAEPLKPPFVTNGADAKEMHHEV